jgi:hypothetical protein
MVVATLAKKIPLIAAGAVVGLLVLGELHPVQAASVKTVVNFDDLPGLNSGRDVPVPDGYGGITWNNQWSYFGSDQSPYTPESGLQRVYTRSSQAAFFFKQAVVFEGAYFSGYSVSSPNFNLFLNGKMVHTSQRLQISSIPQFLVSGYAGLVDEVQVIQSYDFPAYVMDSVTYNSTIASVPSPALLPGLIGFGMAIWRKKTTQRD